MVVQRSNPAMESWRLLLLLMVTLTAMTGVLLALVPDLVEGVRMVIRATARTSLVLFLLAFTASAVARLWPDARFSQWQRRNRRYFGLSFAYSHLIHAIAIVAFARLAPEIFWADRTPASNIPGQLGYLFIALMALTSFDATARFVGPRLWAFIHGFGIWIVWIDFVLAFGKRIPISTVYAVPVLLLLAALCLRLYARKKRHGLAV